MGLCYAGMKNNYEHTSMSYEEQKIKCPKCGESISIDDVLTQQIGEDIRKEMQDEQKEKEAELENQKRTLEIQKKQLEEERERSQFEMEQQVAQKIEIEKINLRKQLQTEVQKEQLAEKNMYEELLREKDTKLQEANQKELEMRKEKIKIEEERKNFELEKQRQLDEERKGIIEEASRKAGEEQQYVIAQLKKQLTDATKAKDDLARKLEQGSQQSQGEVLELELEETLRLEFPFDEITPVPKGVNGADIIHKVMDRNGRLCGQIVWEFKKTKAWSEGWVQKLKDDQRLVRADLAVIVSSVLPQDVKGFAFRDGIWICDIKLATALATALRINLESITREKSMSVGKNEKMEILYSYLTGVEFKQRVEAIVEAFSSMDEGLRKERMAYEKIWSEREKQIRKVITNTVGMYGDLSGLVTLPQIKSLELMEGNE